MTDTCIQVSRKVQAAAAVVFDLLATPHRHHEIDASGMVGADDDAPPITKVGQVFRMNMTWLGEGEPEKYQVDNHVTEFEPNRRIAWTVAETDGEPLGWSWRYDLDPSGEHTSEVVLTYDWTGMSEEARAKYGLPVFGADALESSLDLLGEAVKGA